MATRRRRRRHLTLAIAISVYVLVAIIKKKLRLNVSLHTLLRLVAERAPLNYPRARAEDRAFLSLINSAHSKGRKPRPYVSGLPSSYRSGCEHERLTGCGRCPSPT
jgi:hypothetical protein